MPRLLGADEAGRGPVLGPLVVAAVAVSDRRLLEGRGIRDSKRLSKRERYALAGEIEGLPGVSVAVETVPASEVATAREENGLNLLEVEVFARVLAALAPQPGDDVVVDAADVDAERFGSRIEARLGLRVRAEHRADDCHLVVSAASIVAKARRDRWMQGYAKRVGCDAGSGYPSDPKTATFITEWYVHHHGELPPETRWSWATVARLVGGQRKLDAFDG